jgi:hypothetical protein
MPTSEIGILLPALLELRPGRKPFMLNPIEKLWRKFASGCSRSSHRLAGERAALHQRARAFLDQFATWSHDVRRSVGLLGEGKLAQALRVA